MEDEIKNILGFIMMLLVGYLGFMDKNTSPPWCFISFIVYTVLMLMIIAVTWGSNEKRE